MFAMSDHLSLGKPRLMSGFVSTVTKKRVQNLPLLKTPLWQFLTLSAVRLGQINTSIMFAQIWAMTFKLVTFKLSF